MGWFLDSAALLFDSNFWVAMLVDTALKGVLILIVSSALIRLLKPSASIRHMIRALALTALILLPVCRLLIPPWEVALLPRSPWPDAARTAARSNSVPPALEVGTAIAVPAEPADSASRSAATPGPPLAVAQATPTSTDSAPVFLGEGWSAADFRLFVQRWRTFLVLAWAAGLLFLLARLGLGMACVQMAVARARPLDQEGWDSIARQMRQRLAISRPVRLLLSPQLEVALSVGYSRPTVLLPEVALTWSESRRRSILLHELSHVKRWDNFTNLIAQLACALYWFNPLAWSASKALTVDRERACDDEVLRAGAKASDYAGHLLEIARALSVRRFWGRLEVSQSSALKDRLTAVLNPRLDRRKPTPSGWILVAALSGLAMGPLAAFQPWAESASGLPALETPSREARLFDLKRNRGRRSSPSVADQPELSASGGPSNPAPSQPTAQRRARDQDYRDLLRWTRPRPLQGPAITSISAFGPPSGLARRRGDPSPIGGFLGALAPLAQLDRPVSDQRGNFRQGLPIRFRDSSGDSPDPSPDSPQPPLLAEVARLDLGTLGGAESLAADINDLGFVVGESRKANGLISPFLWTARTGMVDLGNPFDVHTRALDINGAGQVLCETFNVFLMRGLVWTAGEGLVDLGGLHPNEAWTQARAMNERGVVVGSSRDRSGQVRAFIWSRQGGMVDLGVPGESEAWSVNDRGQVAGYAEQVFPTGVETRAFFWDPVKGLRFLRPEGSGLSIATALNNLGQVVGYAEFGDGPPRAFLWDAKNGMVDLGVAEETFPITLATGINDLGQVVGRSLSAQGADESPLVRAFRWTQAEGMQHIGAAQDESLIAINAVGQIVGAYLDDVDAASENSLSILWTESGRVELENAQSTVVAINNRSQAVGSSLNPDQEKHAFLWEVRLKRR